MKCARIAVLAIVAVPIVCQAAPRFDLRGRYGQQTGTQTVVDSQRTNQSSNKQSTTGNTRFGSGTITPTGGTPDLAVAAISHRGDTLYVTVSNRGTRATPITDLRVTITRLSDNRRLTSTSTRVRSLSPRSSQVYKFSSLPLAEVRVFALVDPNSQINELSERNNTRVTLIQKQNATWPDYAIQRIVTRPDGVRVDLVNFGTVGSPQTICLVNVRRNSDNATIRRVAVPVSAMGARGVTSVYVQAAQVSGTTVTATVDPNGRVSEAKERNNTLRVVFGN